MMSEKRPDFEQIKSNVSISRALSFYGVTLKQSGKRLVGACPVHSGNNPRSFTVSEDDQVWYCHSQCGRGGSVLDLVAELEKCSLVEAAQILTDRYALG